MVAVPEYPGDTSARAVIRQFEPARIERELLAQVFEIVSHRPNSVGDSPACAEATRSAAATRQEISRPLSCRAELDAPPRNQLERAA
jgi:hypothetical protein